MRSFAWQHPYLLVAVCFLVLMANALPGIAQDVAQVVSDTSKDVVDAPAPAPAPTPDFDVVAPLNGDVLSGKSVFIIKPAGDWPQQKASLHIDGEPSVDREILSSDNWMVSLDTTALSDGAHEVVFSLCISADACEKKVVSVKVDNASKPALPTGNENPSGGSGTTEPTPAQPNPQNPSTSNPTTVEPAPSAPREPVLVIPSTHAGAFYFADARNPDSIFKSAGDPIKMAQGTYDANFNFFEGDVSTIQFQSMKVEHDDIAAEWQNNAVTQTIDIRGVEFSPVSSYVFRFGFPYENASIQFSPNPDYTFILCSGWNRTQASCSNAEIIADASSNPLIQTREKELVLVFAKKIPHIDTGPFFHFVVPSKQPSKFIFRSLSDGTISAVKNDPLELQEGDYDVNAYFADLPIQFIHSNSLRIDHNGEIFGIESTARSDGVATLALDVDYAFSSGFFALADRYVGGSMWRCELWNPAAHECLGNWSRTYDATLEKGTSYYRFFPPGVDTNQVEVPPTHPPHGNGDVSDEQALLSAVGNLKDIHDNQHFFLGDNSLRQYAILGSLFSDVEVSLQCDPAKKPGAGIIAPPSISPVDASTTIDNAASDVISPNTSDSSNASAPADVNDFNVTINFQGLDSSPITDTPATGTQETPIFTPPIDANINSTNDTDSGSDPLDSGWEKNAHLLSLPGEENQLECDGVSLQNSYVQRLEFPSGYSLIDIGEAKPQLKQVLTLSNQTFVEQQRVVHVRLITHAAAITSDSGVVVPGEKYQAVRTKKIVREIPVAPPAAQVDANTSATDTSVSTADADPNLDGATASTLFPAPNADANAPIPTASPSAPETPTLPTFVEKTIDYKVNFMDINAQPLGSYDWKDYWDANTDPITLVHSDERGTVLDTLLTVRISPGATQVIDPIYELAGFPNYAAGWDGNRNADNIGMTYDSNAGVQVVNIDNNANANDLLITAPNADFNGKTNNGAVYLIRDFNRYSGLFGLGNTVNYDLAFFGGATNDYLGRTSTGQVGSGAGVQIFNTDGNAGANDLVITAVNADVNGKTDAGAVYYIKDINAKIGSYDLANIYRGMPSPPVNVRWVGSRANDRIGNTIAGGQGIKVIDSDRNGYVNDLLIAAAQADFNNVADSGAAYLIMDINALAMSTTVDANYTRDLNQPAFFNVRFDGNYIASENLTSTNNSGDGMFVVNTDKNATANDLILRSITGDWNGKTDAGVIYLIKDINAITGLGNIRIFRGLGSFNAEWVGGGSWMLGATHSSGEGVRVLDLNGDGYVNDMYAIADLADVNGKTDNGAMFIITDINTLNGQFDLNNGVATNYLSRWNGGYTNDKVGFDSNTNVLGGPYANSIQIVNTDGNATSNDAIFDVPNSDYNRTDAGAVVFVKDTNRYIGNFDLNTLGTTAVGPGYAYFIGGTTSDFLGRSNNQDQPVQLVNIDNNLYSNDLIVTDVLADVNGKTDTGAVYLITDINAKTGFLSVANFNNIQARWNGGRSEFLGDTNGSRQGVQLVNADGNAWANDLLITAPSGDANGFTNNGIVYLIKDINRYVGAWDLNRSFDLNSVNKIVPYGARWYGNETNMFLGDTNRSGSGVIFANTDNNTFANDLILTAIKADGNMPEGGEIFYIRDAYLEDNNQYLGISSNYYSLFRGDGNNDNIGDTNASGPGVQVIDSDGNGYANDLLITTYNKDINTFGNIDQNLIFGNGGVFLIKDIDRGNNAYGVLSINFQTPAIDQNVYGVNENFIVNGTITCISTSADCGTVDTNLQYCLNAPCTNFSDVNNVSGMPMQLVSGSNPQTTTLVGGQSYDVNWVVKGIVPDGNYRIQIASTGTTGFVPAGSFFARTIATEPANSYDLGRRVSYFTKYFGSVSGDALGSANGSTQSVQLVNIDNGAYANDLLITAPLADVNGKADAGAVYLIKNIDINTGERDLNIPANFDLRYNGGAASDMIGFSNTGVIGVTTDPATFLIDSDGNGYADDLLIAAPNADTNGKANNGAVYFIKNIDKKVGQFDLANTNNFDAAWYGGIASDNITYTNFSGPGIQILNMDNNQTANDMLLYGSTIDNNGKTNNGAIYYIRDINTWSGNKDFNWSPYPPTRASGAGYNVVFSGAMTSDQMTSLAVDGNAVKVVNIDNNGFANDLMIDAPFADVNRKSNNGGIYLIRDFNRLADGNYDLNFQSNGVSNNYTLVFSGGQAGDSIGLPSTASFTRGEQQQDSNGFAVVDVDNNGYTNDILIPAVSADTNGKTDNGAIYLIKDLDKKNPGIYDFNLFRNGNGTAGDRNSYDVMYVGGRPSDQFPSPTGTGSTPWYSGGGFSLVNYDGGAYPNDLIAVAGQADKNAVITDSGAVYLISNIDTNTGVKDLNSPAYYYKAYLGNATSDSLGDTNGSGPAWQLTNSDGGTVTNDLFLTVPSADVNGKLNVGAVYFIKNVNSFTSGIKDLNNSANYTARWYGSTAFDRLGDTNRSGEGMLILNLDGNAYANDLVIVSPYADANGKTDSGTVHIIFDANTDSGDKLITQSPDNYDIRFNGGSNGNALGSSGGGGDPVQLMNLDGNANANDLVIVAQIADISTKVDAGAIYIVEDVNAERGNMDFKSYVNYTKRFVGSRPYNRLGDSAYSTQPFTQIDVDNNAPPVNDLIVPAPNADANGKTNNGAIAIIQNVLISNPNTTVPDYSFVLMLPSNSCNVGLGNPSIDGACERAWIETTDVIGNADQNQVQPDGQSNGVPFLQYDNQSSTNSDLNIILDLNQSLPSTLKLKVSKIFAGWAGTCTGNTDTNCLEVSTTATNVGKATYSTGTQDLNIYAWGDFINAVTGRVDRNVDSNSISS